MKKCASRRVGGGYVYTYNMDTSGFLKRKVVEKYGTVIFEILLIVQKS